MPNYFISVPIYQIGSNNTYDPKFPLFLDLPPSQLQVEDVAPPFNTTRGVQIYSQIRYFNPEPPYYSNLTKAQILDLANAPSANTYYVSNSGSDSNDGLTEATAWQTLGKVNGFSFLQSETVKLKKGDVWREALLPLVGGGVGTPIVVSSYGTGENPIVSANDVVSSWTEEVVAATNFTVTDPPLSYWMFEDAASPSLDGTAKGNSLSWTGNSAQSALHQQGNFSLGIGTGNASRPFANLSADFPVKGATTAFTFGFWVKVKSTFGGFSTMVSFSNSSSQGFYFATNGTNGLRFRVYGSSTRTIDSLLNNYNDGGWHHVVGRWAGSGGQVSMFIDGVKQTDAGTMTSVTLVTASAFTLNQGDATNFDEMWSYPKSMSDADIIKIYNTGLDGLRNSHSIYYNGGALSATNPYTVIYDDVLQANVATKDILVANTWWWDSVNLRTYIYNNPASHILELGSRSNSVNTNGKSNITISNLHLKGGRGPTGTLKVGGSSNLTILNNEINNCFSGINDTSTGGDNVLIKGNLIHDCYAYGIVANNPTASGWQITDNNEIYNIGNLGVSQIIASLNPQGIYAKIADLLIDGNNLHNISTNDPNLKHAIYIESTALIVRNNFIKDCAAYGVKISTSTNNALIHNNVIIHTGAAVAIFGCTGVRILNNVLYGANNLSQGGWPAHAVYAESYLGVNSVISELKNNIIANNIYFGAPTHQIFINALNSITASDYNDIWSSISNAGNQINYQGVGYTFATWQALGNDAHSINADPQFVNSSSDWHLQAGSLCINAGTNVGLPFTPPAPNIGAY